MNFNKQYEDKTPKIFFVVCDMLVMISIGIFFGCAIGCSLRDKARDKFQKQQIKQGYMRVEDVVYKISIFDTLVVPKETNK